MIEIVANHGRGDYIQKYNVVDELNENTEEKMLERKYSIFSRLI